MTEKLWRCDCGGPHYLSITRWPEEGEAWVTVEDPMRVAYGFWQRLKWAWELLRTGWHWWGAVLLEPGTAREIAAELNRVADEIERDRDGTVSEV